MKLTIISIIIILLLGLGAAFVGCSADGKQIDYVVSGSTQHDLFVHGLTPLADQDTTQDTLPQ